MEELNHRYFISYLTNTFTGYQIRNTEVKLEMPIRGIKDIEVIIGLIKKDSQQEVSIISYQKFEV